MGLNKSYIYSRIYDLEQVVSGTKLTYIPFQGRRNCGAARQPGSQALYASTVPPVYRAETGITCREEAKKK